MAVLYITEYISQAIDGLNNTLAAGKEPAVAQQTIAIGAGSVASAAFNAQTKFVRVHTDAVCSIKFGTAPVAVATAQRMAANATEFYGVVPGDKIAVITNT
jgi:hypothetical protein